jgi:hypothetical protein
VVRIGVLNSRIAVGKGCSVGNPATRAGKDGDGLGAADDGAGAIDDGGGPVVDSAGLAERLRVGVVDGVGLDGSVAPTALPADGSS